MTSSLVLSRKNLGSRSAKIIMIKCGKMIHVVFFVFFNKSIIFNWPRTGWAFWIIVANSSVMKVCEPV